jgi:hypothetical protein
MLLCRFLVPRQQEQQLVGLLQLLEQRSGSSSSSSSVAAATPQHQALAGVADVQLSLTSLEEVFLNIAKQVRRCAALQAHIFPIQYAVLACLRHLVLKGSVFAVPWLVVAAAVAVAFWLNRKRLLLATFSY